MDLKNLDTEHLEHLKLKDIGKNIKAKAKSIGKKIESKAKEVAKKVEKTVETAKKTIASDLADLKKKGGIALKYAPLLPLKPVMIAALKKKGVTNPPKDIGELSYMFFERVVKGSNSYEFHYQYRYNTNNLSHVSEVEKQDTEIASSGITAASQIGLVAATGGTNPQAIDGMVKAIIDFVKKIMAKKKASEEGGAPLNADEKIIADETLKAEDAIDSKVATAEAPKNWFKDNLALIAIVAVVVIYLVVRKK